MNSKVCKNGHPRTPQNTGYAKVGNANTKHNPNIKYPYCKVCKIEHRLFNEGITKVVNIGNLGKGVSSEMREMLQRKYG